MFNLTSILKLDSYKNSHRKQYSPHTEKVYSTWTPRKSRMPGVDKVVVFGLQYFIKDYLIESFNETFFNRPKDEVMQEFKRIVKPFGDIDTSHWEALHDLGYLPLKICALPEGTLCPIRVPMFTIENTIPEFYWLTNFIETILSTEIWKPMTSATIALQYRKICEEWADKTCDNKDHIPFQCHDFSMRGMAGFDSACSSGAGHLLSFKGTDTIPATVWLEKYYNADVEKELVGCSIPATEHSVAETNIIEIQNILDKKHPTIDDLRNVDITMTNLPDDFNTEEWINSDSRRVAELCYINRLLNVYPSGIFSYVADTYNLWEVLTDILPKLKDKIMARDGKIVIRPDSGDPVDIICGLNTNDNYIRNKQGQLCKNPNCSPYEEDLYEIIDTPYIEQEAKGVIELLWDIFGGTINEKGYKVLDPHVGCIYGDAITLERAKEICSRLAQKGFASSNTVFGIGSYTYNMNTRDTFGFALKTTYGIVNGKELQLYKDPITDDGTKKSQKGMVAVYNAKDFCDNEIKPIVLNCTPFEYTSHEELNILTCYDELNQETKENWKEYDLLKPVFEDGKLLVDQSLSEIRNRIEESLKEQK